MRILVLAVVALLVTTVPSSAVAAQSVSVTNAAVGLQALPGNATAIGLRTTKKKTTKKKTETTSEKASIVSIGDAYRGKSALEIKWKLAKAGRTCEMEVKWKNGEKSTDKAVSRGDKICELHVGVPNSSGVSGEATANLTVKDGSKKVGSASVTFQVK
jgi:hypothetical protein